MLSQRIELRFGKIKSLKGTRNCAFYRLTTKVFKMKKIVVLVLLFSFFGFSQEKMEFVYKVTSVGSMYDPTDENSKLIKEYLLKMEQQLEDLTYSLRIKGKESLWFLHDKMSYSEAHMGKALGGDSNYFFDGLTNNYIEQKIFLDNYFIVNKKQKDFKWELSNETKEILGYTCYKAVSTEVKTIKGKDKTFYTIAWYAPALKYQIGPKDFGGLDGLILELTDKKRKYYCTEILSPEKMPMFILEKPTKGKVVTEEEFLIEMNRLAEERGFPSTKY
jgi:GLPGLI family protein